jgi:hypothetical protein
MVGGRSARAAVVLVCCLSLGGCGGSREEVQELLPVSGKVTWNGKPLPQATILYLPQGKGDVSAGKTDDSGEYSLTYANGQPGAVPGVHRVEIRTGGEALDADGNIISESAEILPDRYNVNSRLLTEVKAGSSQINFDLKSK